MFKPVAYDEFGKVLSSLWLFVILNGLFRDMHELAVASTIEEILAGRMNGAPVTDGALLAGAAVIQVLLLGMLLSSLLKPRAARWLNLVVPPLMAFAMFFAPPNDPDDYVFYTIMVGTLLAISFIAWNWREPTVSSAAQIEDVQSQRRQPSTSFLEQS